MPAAAIEFSRILEVIWVALVMGVGVTALFAVVIHGTTRAGEARRSGRGSAIGHSAVAILAAIGFAAAVMFGIGVILGKG